MQAIKNKMGAGEAGRGLEERFCNYLDWKRISSIGKKVPSSKREFLKTKIA